MGAMKILYNKAIRNVVIPLINEDFYRRPNYQQQMIVESLWPSIVTDMQLRKVPTTARKNDYIILLNYFRDSIEISMRKYDEIYFYMTKEKKLPMELARQIAYQSAIEHLLI